MATSLPLDKAAERKSCDGRSVDVTTAIRSLRIKSRLQRLEAPKLCRSSCISCIDLGSFVMAGLGAFLDLGLHATYRQCIMPLHSKYSKQLEYALLERREKSNCCGLRFVQDPHSTLLGSRVSLV